jgi:Na+-driven multidrug efflux pump
MTSRSATASLAGKVARFALPATSIMFLSGLFLIVDTYFVARLGEDALAGASLVFPLYLILLTTFGGGLGIGLSVVIAVRLGRDDLPGAQRAVGSALALAVGSAALLAALFLVGGRWLFSHMSSSPVVVDAAMDFARPIFLGAPVIAISLTMINLLRSEKKLGAAGLMLLVGGAVNTVLNPLLIHGGGGLPALGVAGAGLATTVGFAVTGAMGVVFSGGPGRLSLLPSRLDLVRADATEILGIALPTIATYVANNVVLLALTSIWARFGMDALNGFGLTSRLEYVLVLGTYGFGGAIVTLGGEAWGAGKRDELVRICAISAVFAFASTAVVSALLLGSPASWFALFDAPAGTVAAGADYLRIVALAYPCYTLGLTLNYGYQTIAQAYRPLMYVTLRGFLVALPVAGLAVAMNASADVAAAGVAGSFVLYGLLSAVLLRPAMSRVADAPGRATPRVSPISVSPYPWTYTVRWPWYFWRPSMSNHTGLGKAPLDYERPDIGAQRTIRLCAIGDIMVMQQDRVPVLDPGLVEILSGSDIVIGCCESPVTRQACDPAAKYSFLFDMPADYVRGIIDQSGVAPEKWYLSVANNHAGDVGRAGLPATLRYLTALGVNPIGYRGPGSTPWHVIECDPLRIGIAAWTRWLNLEVFDQSHRIWRSSDVTSVPWDAVRSELQLDCLIGSAHWEYEWQHFPRRETRALARTLHGSGFDLIVGSHPHVLQPIEWLGRTLCAYSLGNFCSGLGISWPARMTQVLAMEIGTEGEHRGKVVRYRLHLFAQVEDQGRVRIVPLHDAPAWLSKRIRARVPRIFARQAPARRRSRRDERQP